MTCIVGVEFEGEVWIGSDSATVSGTQIAIQAEPKVFQVGPYLIGCCGSIRVANLLRHTLEVSPVGNLPAEQADKHMAVEFVNRVIHCLKAGGAYEPAKHEMGIHESTSSLLVGFQSRLYNVSSAFGVNRYAGGYNSTGSAYEIALGALAALDHYEPFEQLTRALQVACEHHIYARPPFNILRLLPFNPEPERVSNERPKPGVNATQLY